MEHESSSPSSEVEGDFSEQGPHSDDWQPGPEDGPEASGSEQGPEGGLLEEEAPAQAPSLQLQPAPALDGPATSDPAFIENLERFYRSRDAVFKARFGWAAAGGGISAALDWMGPGGMDVLPLNLAGCQGWELRLRGFLAGQARRSGGVAATSAAAATDPAPRSG